LQVVGTARTAAQAVEKVATAHPDVVLVDVALGAESGFDLTRQHNEPAGNQDVWHYHMHVFPRYAGDDLYFTRPQQDFSPAEQRLPYADKLREHFESTAPT
jgi:histidine triad (HIT) family protein